MEGHRQVVYLLFHNSMFLHHRRPDLMFTCLLHSSVALLVLIIHFALGRTITLQKCLPSGETFQNRFFR